MNRRFTLLLPCAVALTITTAHAQKRLPKSVCGGKLVVENVNVQLAKSWPPNYVYFGDVTNKSTAPVTYDLRFLPVKAGVKVILIKSASAVTIAPGKSNRYELGRTVLPEGAGPGLDDKDIEDSMQVTCK